ncbi:MAG: hypothetical protein OEU54_03630 [Gemmatimonadota bacterium]|nr:hypothetical protein [Gemmatimonadota bacterium]
MRRTIFVLGLSALVGCGESTTGPGAANLCATSQGVEVCAPRSEYRPNEVVSVSVTNETSATIYIDTCSVKPVGKTSREAAFPVDYSPQNQCGNDVDVEEIVANMIELPAGQSIQVTGNISSFAFQGFYRINVWVLDVAGARVSNLPVFSGTFEVFPSAGT